MQWLVKMIKILEGGHWEKKGYNYTLFLTLPSYSSARARSITGSELVSKKFEANSGFFLTSNNNYCNIVIKLLGFGMGLEIHNRS
jgi:hypothetical protein